MDRKRNPIKKHPESIGKLKYPDAGSKVSQMILTHLEDVMVKTFSNGLLGDTRSLKGETRKRWKRY